MAGGAVAAVWDGAELIVKMHHNKYRTYLSKLPRYGKVYGILDKIVVPGVEVAAGWLEQQVDNTPLHEASQGQHHILPA